MMCPLEQENLIMCFNELPSSGENMMQCPIRCPYMCEKVGKFPKCPHNGINLTLSTGAFLMKKTHEVPS